MESVGKSRCSRDGSMKLTIPYFPQEKNNSCGLACLRMMLAYHDDLVTEKELSKQIDAHSFGAFSTDLGLIALKRGYKVHCKTMYLPLVDPLKIKPNTEITLEMLQKLHVPAKTQMTYDSWINYLQAGGELIYDLPSQNQLNMALDQNIPVLISLTLTLIERFTKHWDAGHYVLISGEEDGRYLMNDPASQQVDGQLTLASQQLLTAWTVNAVQSSNYLMTILPTR